MCNVRLHFCLVIDFPVSDSKPAATINKHKQDAGNENVTRSSWNQFHDLPSGVPISHS